MDTNKEHPIIFSTDMTNKTMTRRIIKPQPVTINYYCQNWTWCVDDTSHTSKIIKCPYGIVGDKFVILEKIEDILAYSGDGEITYLRVERLRDMTTEDAIAEGMTPKLAVELLVGKNYLPYCIMVGGMKMLWDSLHKKQYRWEENPFVWVISFRRIK